MHCDRAFDPLVVNSNKLLFHHICLNKYFATGAGFSNIPGKYENVVFLIKNPPDFRNEY